jgi:uncharacterized protein involved in outer membrane biogenesis
MKSKLLRKVGWSVLAASCVLVLTALLVPLFVDVDQYRPRLVTEVNRRIRGKLELGKLQLSLWGRIRVGIEGLKLVDSRGRVLVQVKDAWFGVPVSSLFSGAPELTLHLGKPEIQVAKDRAGAINLLQVLPTESTQAVPADVAAESSAPSAGSVELPAILVRARFGLDIQEAQASYRDEATALAFQVNALDVRVKDLSLSRPTLFEVRARLAGRMGKLFEMHGPAKLSGRLETQIDAGKLQSYRAQAKADLSAVAIEVPGAFIKKEGVPAQADLRLAGNLQSVQLESLQAQFHNVKLSGSGSMQLASTTVPSKLKMALQVPAFDLSEWTALLPALQGSGLQGKIGLEAGVEGPVDAFQYRASVQMADLGAKVPGLKAMPTFSGDVKIRTDQVESFQWVLKAPGTDLTLSGSVLGFTAPKIQAQFTSRSGMDLDQWVDWNFFAEKKKAELAAAKASSSSAAAGSGSPSAAQPASSDDLDALMNPLRELEPARRASGTIQASLPLIQAYGVRMTAVQARLQLKELAMVLEPFSMQVFEGKVSAKASMDLKPKAPTYQFTSQTDGIQLSKAVESQLQLFKNTLLGKASFNIQGSGSSFNPEPAMRNLNAKGSLKVTNATFATLDIGRMASDAVNRAVEQVSQKVPMLKGMALRTPPGKDSRYDWIASDFTISGGVFQAPNFATQAATGFAVDLKGATRLGLLDLALKADWEVIDTHNVLKARDLSVQVAGTDVPHVLAQGDGPVRFPVSVSGTAMAPQFSTLQVPEYLAKVAGENLAKAAGNRAKAELKQRATEALGNAAQKAAPAIKNALKGLFGR